MTVAARTDVGHSGAALGARICAIAGLVWAAWGSGALPPGVGVPLLVLAVLGVVLILRALRRGSGGGHVELGPSYWRIVVSEFAAIGLGLAVIDGALGSPEANAGWIALVVGLHFFGLARIWPGGPLDVLGVLVTLAGVAGLVSVALGAGMSTATAISALPTALVLLGSAGMSARRTSAHG